MSSPSRYSEYSGGYGRFRGFQGRLGVENQLIVLWAKRILNMLTKVAEGFVLAASVALGMVAFVSCYGPHHPRGSHRHYKPQTGSNPLKDTQLLQDEVHIKEDLFNMVEEPDTKKMSPAELEFHYFKIHDFDNNTKLDGLEILQAIQHTVHDDDSGEVNSSAKDLQQYIDLIDRVLEEDDLDRDGYLSYVEYVIGRGRERKG